MTSADASPRLMMNRFIVILLLLPFGGLRWHRRPASSAPRTPSALRGEEQLFLAGARQQARDVRDSGHLSTGSYAGRPPTAAAGRPDQRRAGESGSGSALLGRA